MGSTVSKFREAVRVGDHSRAYELYYNKKVIRDSLDPKEICYNQDGACVLHYTARYAMQPLYEDFIDNKRVSPLICDGNQQTCLHLICSSCHGDDDEKLRYDMLCATLSNDFVRSNVSRALSSTNIDGNTPLHLACREGLQTCVQLLIDAGADPTATNCEGHTPIDVATNAKHEAIAKKLETRIVFSPSAGNNGLIVDMDEDASSAPPTSTTHIPPLAMKDQEIQSMKDQLLIETTELLGVSLFTAEALLRNHGKRWSKEQLLDAWMTDAAGTCDKAGVELPAMLTVDNIDESLRATLLEGGHQLNLECTICYLEVDQVIDIPCEHIFCTNCWQQYLHDKIVSGQIHNIVCPQYACYKLVPIHVVEKLVSREMAHKYLQFDIKAFVDSNPNIRWCPHPGCGQAIQKPDILEESELQQQMDGVLDREETPPTCITVHCGQDHYFCWRCGETAHEPCTCKEWKDWLKKVDDMTVKIGAMSTGDLNEAATSQWISSNSKPCPNCKSPIEKNDGCNHMKCGKCRHDYCWMCLDPWSKHSSATGGYFECNRYKEIDKVKNMLKERRDKTDNYERIVHFKHYYSRYSNHRHSLQMETGYLHSADDKMAALRDAALAEGAAVGSLLFVAEAVRTLVEARLVIAASYGHGFFIVIVRERDAFEKEQGELEEQIEALAEVVARPHLRKPRTEIMRLTRTVAKMTRKFVQAVQNGSFSTSPAVPPSLFTTMEVLRQRRDRIDRERERIDREQERLREEELVRREEEEEEERQLQEALQVSQQQFDEDSRLKADTELAMLLSIQNDKLADLDKHIASLHAINNNSPAYSGDQTTSLEGTFPYSSVSQNSEPDPLILPPPLSPISNNKNIDLERWRQTLLLDPPSTSSSSSPSSTPEKRDSYGPIYGEDEDLATAIALSLSTFPDNKQNDLSTDMGGAIPLTDILQSTTRQAANV